MRDTPERLIVDGMNVIGSRPTGWWRDRDGAKREFIARLQDFAGRIADNLGTDAQATADAISQVAEEMRSEALETRLQSAIDSGRITEEQAQEYSDKAASGGWHGKGFGFKGGEDFADRVGAILNVDGDNVASAIEQAIKDMGSEALEARLQSAINSGRITEEQAAEIREKVESGDWKAFGKRGRGHHGRYGGKGFWGRGHKDYDSGNYSPAAVPNGQESSTY